MTDDDWREVGLGIWSVRVAMVDWLSELMAGTETGRLNFLPEGTEETGMLRRRRGMTNSTTEDSGMRNELKLIA